MRQLVLASSSSARKNLLTQLKISFQYASPDIDETPHSSETASELVVRLAIEKARTLADVYPDALLIGADTVGVLDSQFLHKPLTLENAICQLQLMSDQWIHFHTGLCIYDARQKTTYHALENYAVKFRALTLAQIKNYLHLEADAIHCAGSVKVEGFGITLLEKLQGDDYTALIGLPLIRLTSLLAQAGNPLV